MEYRSPPYETYKKEVGCLMVIALIAIGLGIAYIIHRFGESLMLAVICSVPLTLFGLIPFWSLGMGWGDSIPKGKEAREQKKQIDLENAQIEELARVEWERRKHERDEEKRRQEVARQKESDLERERQREIAKQRAEEERNRIEREKEKLRLEGVKCWLCNGVGYTEYCNTCGGTGYLGGERSYETLTERCPDCMYGRDREDCSECKGYGYIPR